MSDVHPASSQLFLALKDGIEDSLQQLISRKKFDNIKLADQFVGAKKQLKKIKIEREALESWYFEMQERLKEIEVANQKIEGKLKEQATQLTSEHKFNLQQKDKEYSVLKSQILPQESKRDELVDLLDKLRKKQVSLHGKYGRTKGGDPKGSMPSDIDYIKSMDLDDIDLITERLCKYGLTFDNSTHSQKQRKMQIKRPKIPKLDLDIVFRMLEEDNEHEEYEEEEEEMEEECNSGKQLYHAI